MVSLGPVSVLCVVCRGCVVCERACAMRGCVRAAERGVDHLGWVSCANSRTPQGAPGAPGVLVRRSKSIGSPYALLSPLSLRPHCGRPGGGAGQAGHTSGAGALALSTPHSSSVHTLSKAPGARRATHVPSLQARQGLGCRAGRRVQLTPTPQPMTLHPHGSVCSFGRISYSGAATPSLGFESSSISQEIHPSIL